jgi:hypothetical protein
MPAPHVWVIRQPDYIGSNVNAIGFPRRVRRTDITLGSLNKTIPPYEGEMVRARVMVENHVSYVVNSSSFGRRLNFAICINSLPGSRRIIAFLSSSAVASLSTR